MNLSKICALFAATAVLAGCASGGKRAPIVERGEAGKTAAVAPGMAQKKPVGEKDWRPDVHIVQKGDTMYSIAFNYGFDYHELADLNGIKNPSIISIGQEIRLFPGKTVGAAAASGPKADDLPIKEQPKLVKYDYSETVVAQIGKVQQTPPARPEPSVKAKPPIAPAAPAASRDDYVEEAELQWSMPAQGKLIAGFSEAANRKGIDIAGKLGQPVVASAPGKVVYSGSGLRGYGKLVIIKHNNTYLSAYAHNDQILVKEGQSVARGEKIATMGKTDTDQVKLHFEVRRLGKPVDPAKFVPLGKS